MFDLAQLRASVTGAVIGPGDAEYDQARTILPGGIDRRPAAVVRVADSKDIAHVLAIAREPDRVDTLVHGVAVVTVECVVDRARRLDRGTDVEIQRADPHAFGQAPQIDRESRDGEGTVVR